MCSRMTQLAVATSEDAQRNTMPSPIPGSPCASISVSSLITQSVQKKNQPRSPRDQSSPKRARVDEQEDTSSTERVQDTEVSAQDGSCLSPRGVAPPACAELALQQDEGAEGQSSVFSPHFHVPRNRRPSVEVPHAEAIAYGLAHGLQGVTVHSASDLNPQHTQQNGTALAAECNGSVPSMIPINGLYQQQQQQYQIQEAQYQHDMATKCQAQVEQASVAEAENGHVVPQQEHAHAHHTVIPEAVEHPTTTDATDADEELDYIDFDPLLFIKLLPPLEQVVPKHRKPLLPRKAKNCKLKTLVLDLDETLVHSCLEPQPGCDFTFPVHFNNQEHIIHVRQRPHLHDFMNRVAELFEVVVFTASQKVYAEKLLNIIDPERKLIKYRIFRESCVLVDGNYLKDLTALGRDLKSTLIVDNSICAFGFQVDNGVPIESWYDDPADTELVKMLPFLEELVDAEDVRPAIRSKFRMREMIDRVEC